MPKDEVKVKCTQSLQSFQSSLREARPWSGQKELQQIFDEMPIEEIRHLCLGNITDVEWLGERTETYLKAHDFQTVFMLLRTLAVSGGEESQPEILQSMVDTTKSCLESQSYLKDALVILCGKIYHSPRLYNDKVREIFKDVLERYDRKGKYGTHEEESRILMRVFLIIGKVGDKSFLPLLRRCLPDAKNLKHLMDYANICKDEVATEGMRMLLIRHLENLEEN